MATSEDLRAFEEADAERRRRWRAQEEKACYRRWDDWYECHETDWPFIAHYTPVLFCHDAHGRAHVHALPMTHDGVQSMRVTVRGGRPYGTVRQAG